MKQFVEELIPELAGVQIVGLIKGPGAGLEVPRSMTMWKDGQEQIGLLAYNEPYLTIDFSFKAKKLGEHGKRTFNFEGEFPLYDPEVRSKIEAFMAKSGFTDLYDFSLIEGV